MTILLEKNEIVVPGQVVAEDEDYRIESGVYRDGNRYISQYVGVFMERKGSLLVRPLSGNYLPKVGDIVIGIVEDALLTSWKVQVGGPYVGILLASNATDRDFDPIKGDTRKIFAAGDAIKAEIVSFDRTRDPQLTTKKRGLGKLVGGRLIDVSPNYIKRVIGRKGSMVNLIKKHTNCDIVVGYNGRIWISGKSVEDELLAISAIRRVEQESHVDGLTKRIEQMLVNRTFE